MDYVEALERENRNLRKVIALMIVQAGGIVSFSEVDQEDFLTAKYFISSRRNNITGEWILEVHDE